MFCSFCFCPASHCSGASLTAAFSSNDPPDDLLTTACLPASDLCPPTSVFCLPTSVRRTRFNSRVTRLPRLIYLRRIDLFDVQPGTPWFNTGHCPVTNPYPSNEEQLFTNRKRVLGHGLGPIRDLFCKPLISCSLLKAKNLIFCYFKPGWREVN